MVLRWLTSLQKDLKQTCLVHMLLILSLILNGSKAAPFLKSLERCFLDYASSTHTFKRENFLDLLDGISSINSMNQTWELVLCNSKSLSMTIQMQFRLMPLTISLVSAIMVAELLMIRIGGLWRKFCYNSTLRRSTQTTIINSLHQVYTSHRSTPISKDTSTTSIVFLTSLNQGPSASTRMQLLQRIKMKQMKLLLLFLFVNHLLEAEEEMAIKTPKRTSYATLS